MSHRLTSTILPLKTLGGFFLSLSLLLSPDLIQAASTNSVKLSWTANSESDLAGYKIYQGTTAGSYGPSIDVGNTTVYTANNLQAGLTYYYATTAYDTSGNESLPSVEVSKQIPAADTTAPSVILTAPATGSTLSSSVTLTATATDDVGVVGVQFQLNGANLGAEDTTNSYTMSWDTTTVADGSYTLTATARDATGNTTTSAPVTVTVSNISVTPPDTTPPTVTLTAPSNGSTLSGVVTLSASATDNVGIVGVQFQLNGTNLGAEDTTNAYSITWDTTEVPPGQYSISAMARDAAGNTTTATPLLVTVETPPDSIPPTVPGIPTAQVVSSSEISLNWTASTDNVAVTGYLVFRDGVLIDNPTTTSYKGVNLTPSTTYTYVVTASDAAGNTSNPSTPVSATTLAPPDSIPPSSPTGLQGTSVSSSEVGLSWQASTDNVGVTGYHIFRNGEFIAVTTTTSYQDASLTPLTTYTYTITAWDEAGNESLPSTSLSATTWALPDTTPPSKPTEMKVVDIVVTKQILSKGNKMGRAVVTIHDAAGNPVLGATVTGDFSGRTTEIGSGVTNKTSQVTIFSSLNRKGAKGRRGGEWCFEVRSVTHGTLTYDSSLNAVTKSCEGEDIF